VTAKVTVKYLTPEEVALRDERELREAVQWMNGLYYMTEGKHVEALIKAGPKAVQAMQEKLDQEIDP